MKNTYSHAYLCKKCGKITLGAQSSKSKNPLPRRLWPGRCTNGKCSANRSNLEHMNTLPTKEACAILLKYAGGKI